MTRGTTSMRRWLLAAALLALAVLSVVVAPSSQAQVLPDFPPLPAPPAEGNLLADILGPASATACDTAATAYALVGPIASAQLPPEVQPLITELDPYLALITYACGYLVSPPSGVVCAVDQSLNSQLGVLGLPVGLPQGAQVLRDTTAGIEQAFRRLGVDIGTEASQQLAIALGCGVPAPDDFGSAAALPLPASTPGVTSAPPIAIGSSFDPSAIPSVAPRAGTPGRTTQLPGTHGQLGSIRYPVKDVAALLLALPLALLAAAVALAPRFRRPERRRPGGGAPWTAAP